MATLTATASPVNFTSSTNWSPAQIPADGDDLVIPSNYTLRMDVSRTFNTITMSGANSILQCWGSGTITVQATNGWIMSATSYITLLSSAGAFGGTGLILVGTWTFSNLTSTANILSNVSAGFPVTLRTVGSDPSAELIRNLTSFLVTPVNAHSTNATLTFIGRISAPSVPIGGSMFVISGGTLNWTFSGQSNIGGASLITCTVGGSYSITGTEIISNSNGNIPILSAGGSGTFLSSFNLTSTGTNTANTGIGLAFRIGAALTNPMIHNGNVVITGNLALVSAIAAGTFRISAGTIVVPVGAQLYTWLTSSMVLDLSDVVIQNSGEIAIINIYSGTVITTSSTLIQNMTNTATASAINTSALDNKIINLTSSPPTLPSTSNVVTGVQYGYTGSLLTGTGLIINSDILSEAIINALEEAELGGGSDQSELLNLINSIKSDTSKIRSRGYSRIERLYP